MVKQVTGGLDPKIISEDQLSQAVTDLARLLGYRLQYHTHDSRKSAEGFPDLVMVNPRVSRVLFVELKSERGQLTEAQLLWYSALTACNVEAYVWRPEDWKDGTIESILKGKPREDTT